MTHYEIITHFLAHASPLSKGEPLGKERRMTREEAIAKVARGGLADDEIILTAQVFVDMLRHLGILKLDEPTTANARAIEVFEAASSDPRCGPHQLLTRLEVCGLKVVEK